MYIKIWASIIILISIVTITLLIATAHNLLKVRKRQNYKNNKSNIKTKDIGDKKNGI